MTEEEDQFRIAGNPADVSIRIISSIGPEIDNSATNSFCYW
jgi:hypothetical protein